MYDEFAEQGMNGHHASPGESYGQEGGGGAAAVRVGKYSAEERKERIERYRSKRNQRNFHKKITVCIYINIYIFVFSVFKAFVIYSFLHSVGIFKLCFAF